MDTKENIKLEDCTLGEDGTVTCEIGKDDLKKVVGKGISPQHVILTGKDGQEKSDEKPAEPIKSDVSSKPKGGCTCSKSGHDEPKTTENETKPTPEGVDSSQSDSEYRSADQELAR